MGFPCLPVRVGISHAVRAQADRALTENHLLQLCLIPIGHKVILLSRSCVSVDICLFAFTVDVEVMAELAPLPFLTVTGFVVLADNCLGIHTEWHFLWDLGEDCAEGQFSNFRDFGQQGFYVRRWLSCGRVPTVCSWLRQPWLCPWPVPSEVSCKAWGHR